MSLILIYYVVLRGCVSDERILDHCIIYWVPFARFRFRLIAVPTSQTIPTPPCKATRTCRTAMTLWILAVIRTPWTPPPLEVAAPLVAPSGAAVAFRIAVWGLGRAVRGRAMARVRCRQPALIPDLAHYGNWRTVSGQLKVPSAGALGNSDPFSVNAN